MYLFDEFGCSPISISNKNKLAPKKRKIDQNSSQRKSNLEFLLLCSEAPEGPSPCKSIILIYFHNPLIIPNILPLIFLVLKYYRNALFYYRKQAKSYKKVWKVK